jgi:hypothetical protein
MYRISDIVNTILDFGPEVEKMYYMKVGQGCCGSQQEGRHFLTKEEKIAKLKEYKDWLDSESKGVDETISKLKKAS